MHEYASSALLIDFLNNDLSRNINLDIQKQITRNQRITNTIIAIY